ncbi:hypothetical protein [Polluticoccus soli]|uniref:hypothetical protein n=1 Tax=Polluticoccus soli TaxID=3034150 RepID=UPI0023E26C6D|nr:hypothetical protein [Flavipsychrobacter sp. JY13-12]
MRYSNRFIAITAILFSSIQASAQPKLVNVKPLYNYDFVGDASDLKPGINCFVITQRKHFDKFFGKTNRPDTPHFAKENVLVLLMPETRKDSKLSFKRVDTKAGDFIEAYCNLDLYKGTVNYKFYPMALAVIPKYPGIKKVNFYNDKTRLIKSVEIKN